MMRAASFLITGIRNFTKEGYEKASKSFTEAPERPDLRGKLIMVTGANQGIGLQIATSLASKGCNVMMVCRNGERGNEAVESVKAKTNNQNVELGICDVSSLSSIKEFTSDFNASGKSLYCLVNNAGALYNDGEKSVDGYELNFALNTLGTYALTRALKPALEASAPSRVIFVSSGGMLTEPLVVDNLQAEDMKKINGVAQYARDKRRQSAIAERLAKDWSSSNISVYSMHPGWVDTVGVQTSIPGFYKTFQGSLRSLEQGADTVVWLCLEDAEKLEAGGYYLDRKPQDKHLWGVFGNGTKYSENMVDVLISKLDEMSAPCYT